MALPISDRALQLSKQINVHSNIIFRLPNADRIFGAAEISEYIRIGDPGLLIGNDWVIGGVRLLDNQSSYISFSNGTLTRITQKLDPSRAQGSSVQQMVVSLIDKDDEISSLVAPGIEIDDILYEDCEVLIGFKEGAFPEDYSVIFRGIVDSYQAGPGYVNFILSSSEAKKVPPIFVKQQTELTSDLDYRSVTIQDLFYQNREDVSNSVSVEYENTGVAGSENVIVTGTAIKVQIQSGVSTAKQIRKAIEEQASAQLVTVKITGDSTNPQITQVPTILGSGSVLNVNSTDGFIEPNDALETFVRINDELIQYTGITPTTFTGITRGAFNSDPALHKTEDEVESYYLLSGNPLDLACKLMLSQGPTYYAEDVAIKSFNLLPDGNRIDNAIIFDQIDVEREYGVSVGDLIKIEGSSNVGNNVTDSIVLEVGLVNDGSYLVLSDSLIDEGSTAAVAKFKSQFNVLPIGMKMLPKEVDVKQHQFIKNTYIPDLEFAVPIDEENNGKTFIEQQLYLPAACFSVPRKGQSSVAYHTGPLASEKIITLDTSNVKNANQIKVERATSINFANTINYSYNYNPIEDKFAKIPAYSLDSDRAVLVKEKVGEKPINIDAKGVTTALNGNNIAQQSSNRLLKRYSLGAEYINGVKTLFGFGYTIEIGDIVAVDYKSLQLTDFKTGTRSGEVRLMECLNKTLDNKTGEISLDLVNTVYGVDERYGVISPSSMIAAGSTTTKVLLKKTFSTQSFQRESLKWKNYIGQEVVIRSADHSIIYTTNIISFDNNNPQGMLVDPPLALPPSEDWVVECPRYPDDTDPRVLAFWKNRHAFLSHTLQVDVGLTLTQFDLLANYPGIPFEGSVIRVRNEDYSEDSGDVTVIGVSGLTITVNKSLGFIPDSSHYVDLIGFPDKLSAYRII
jgi:hypothetical protein